MTEIGDALVVRDVGPAELRGGTITNPAAFVVETRITGDVRAIITLSALEAKTGKAAQAYAFQCAAAPDMLDALQTAFFAMGRAGANASLDHPLREAWEAARAAIAKATGTKP